MTTLQQQADKIEKIVGRERAALVQPLSTYTSSLRRVAEETSLESSVTAAVRELGTGLASHSNQARGDAIKKFRESFFKLCEQSEFVYLLEELAISGMKESRATQSAMFRVIAGCAAAAARELNEKGQAEKAIVLLCNANNLLDRYPTWLGPNKAKLGKSYLRMNLAQLEIAGQEMAKGDRVIRTHPIGSFDLSYILKDAERNIRKHLRERTAAAIPAVKLREFVRAGLGMNAAVHPYQDPKSPNEYLPIDEIPDLKRGVLPRRK